MRFNELLKLVCGVYKIWEIYAIISWNILSPLFIFFFFLSCSSSSSFFVCGTGD
jgi:hypothetical protein